MQNFHQEPQQTGQSSINEQQNVNQEPQNENIQQLPEVRDEPQNVRIILRAYYKYPILEIRLRNKLFVLFLINFIFGVWCSIAILFQENAILCQIIQSLILLEYIFLSWSYYSYSKKEGWYPHSMKLNIFLARSYILLILNLISLIWQVENALQIIRIISSLIFCLFYQFALIEFNR